MIAFSDFIWPFFQPYMGVIPNPKMAFFPNFVYFSTYFPNFYEIFSQMFRKRQLPKIPNKITGLQPSVCPFCYLLNHWTKSNQIFVCEFLTWLRRATASFFGSTPGALGRGQKSIIIKFQLRSHFQRFLYQTLSVFSQIKDIRHIKQNFHSVIWVMPQWWDFGVLGGLFFQTWSCDISN